MHRGRAPEQQPVFCSQQQEDFKKDNSQTGCGSPLCTGAGVGLAVLWRTNPSWKQNLFITGLTWAAGAFVGVAMQVVVAVFA